LELTEKNASGSDAAMKRGDVQIQFLIVFNRGTSRRMRGLFAASAWYDKLAAI
jgi:hypothetical protein